MDARAGIGLAVLLAAGVAGAADVPVLGTKLVLKFKAGDASKSALAFKATDPQIDVGAVDPTAEGATVEVLNPNPTAAQSTVFSLPATGWTVAGSPTNAYKYKDKDLAHGPVKSALIKGGKLVKLSAKGASMTFGLGAPQQSVGVIFASGTVRYCAFFGGTVKNDDGSKFIAAKAPAPGACPSLPATTSTTTSTTGTTVSTTSTTSTSVTTATVTTTTVTTTTLTTTSTAPSTTTTTTSASTTTSTTGVPVCGNGVREGAEQCDDGNEENTDACTNQCLNARCGDGIARFGVEQCDDGNTNNADCCNDACQITPSVCGNGCVSPGESCDDGNTVNGDACPSTCVINPCTASGTTQQVTISLKRTSPPAPSSLVAFNLLFDYPDGQVSIPGSGGAASVATATPFLLSPSGRSVTRNDLDYAIRLSVLGTTSMLPNTNVTAVFHVNFDLCNPATVPTAGQFSCTILGATASGGTDFTAAQLAGLACTVTVP